MKKYLMGGCATLMGIVLFMSCINVSNMNAHKHQAALKPSKTMKTLSGSSASVNKLDVSGVVDVTYTQSSSNCTYKLTLPENYASLVTVKIKDGELTVKFNNMHNYVKEGLNIKLAITTPSLKEVEMSGATSFTTGSLSMPGQKVEFDLSGSSNVTISNLTAAKMDVEVSGASEFNVGNSKIGEAECEISGASHLTMRNGNFNLLDCEVSGASEGTFTGKAVTGKFSASGASSLNISGIKVQNLSKNSSGVSKIHD